MTDAEGYVIEAALDCGFEMTNDDGDEFHCTQAQVLDLFARVEATVIERCAVAAEAQNRVGFEWVRDSLWDQLMKRAGQNVRALKAKRAAA